MKSVYRILLLSITCNVVMLTAKAQNNYDTVKVMSYNVLNYGFPATNDCPALITANKHGWLRTILQYTDPDIIGLEKMDASPASFTSDTIIATVFDSVCAGCYGHTPYTNVSGYSKENMLYFKTAKFGWISTTTIYAGDSTISDINLHTLFYKNSISANNDTIFLHIILVHLASGANSASQRGTEIAGAMAWLNTHITTPGNYIFMGDFNTQSSAESCFQQMINSSNPNTLFNDVANQLGNWNGSPNTFAPYLTQSTRASDPGDCGAAGGMDDWFDHLLCTNPIMADTGKVNYVPNSFYVIGQDGLHVNKSLLASPTNASVPAGVLNALYYMSEHLPVIMQLAIDTADDNATGIQSYSSEGGLQWQYSHVVSNELWIKGNGDAGLRPATLYSACVYDLAGRLTHTYSISPDIQNTLPVSDFANGAYILVVLQNGLLVMEGKFIKIG